MHFLIGWGFVGSFGDVDFVGSGEVVAAGGDEPVPGVGGFEVGFGNDEEVEVTEEVEALVVNGVDVVVAEFESSVGGNEDVVDGVAFEGFAGTFEHLAFEALDVGMEHVKLFDAFELHEVVDGDDGCAGVCSS